MAPGLVSPRAPPDLAQARDGLSAGDPVEALPSPMPAQSIVSEEDRRSVVADEQLVDDRRPEHVVPVEAEVAEGLIVRRGQDERERLLVPRGPRSLAIEKRTKSLSFGGGVPVQAQVALVGADGAEGVAHVVAR